MKKMKRILSAVIAVCMIAALIPGCGKKTEIVDSITVFNYGQYIDPEVLDIFTEETGIEVKYEEATTPEELYTKYKAGAIDYDVLCTSDYMLERLINEGELQEIDQSSMEYVENIGDKYWEFSKSFDSENKYTIPYFWGTVGILYDTTKVKEPIDSWDVLFNHEYSGEIVMQNSMRDSFMVAEKYLGYSLNTENADEINAAKELLLEQKADVQAYLVDEARDEVVAGNATMAIIYSGEAYLGREYNEDLAYVVPKEGSNVWLDSWGITKDSQHAESATKFLDFLCREDIARMNFDYIYYSTPNDAVFENLSEEELADEILVPSDESIANCEVYKQTSAETTDLMNNQWKEIKAE